MPDIKSVHHVSVTVTDLDRSVAWYERVFGFTKVKEDKHPDGTVYFVLLGSADFAVLVALHVHPSNDKERFSETRTGLDHVGFTVASHAELEEWQARLTELDIEHSPVNDQPGYSVVVFRDPDNIQLEFIAMGSS